MNNKHNKILGELQEIIDTHDSENDLIVKNTKKKDKTCSSDAKISMTQKEKIKLLNDIDKALSCLKPIVDALI